MTADRTTSGQVTRRSVLQFTGAALAMPVAPFQHQLLENGSMPFTPKFVDLVRNVTSVQGTGPVTLGAAVSGYTSLAAAIAPGEQFYYCIQGVDKPAEREVGRGTMQADGTIAREAVSGALTSFSGGSKTIALVAAAEWFSRADRSGATDVRSFGATGDGVTDDGAAFVAAIAHLKTIATTGFGYGSGSPRLFVPAGTYFLGTTTLDLTHTLIIEGDSTGDAGGASSVLIWAAGATGIRVQTHNTAGGTGIKASANSGSVPRGDASIIRNLYLKGGYSAGVAEGEFHGIQLRGRAIIRDVFIEGFQGDGVHIKATAGTGEPAVAGDPAEGNANNFHIDKLWVSGCRHGLFVDGADANAGNVIGGSFNGNRQWGVWDSSFLGNSYVGCHTAGNGATFGVPVTTVVAYLGNRYSVVADRDYQAGRMRASLAAGGRGHRRIDSASALSAAAAKSLASDALARRWAGRDRITLRLSPAYLDLRPGQIIRVPPIPGLYRIEELTVDGLVVIAEARRTHLPGGVLLADPGRGNLDPDTPIGASVPLLLDLPPLPIVGSDGLAVVLALGCTGAFRPTPVELTANGQPLARLTVGRAAATGVAATLLGDGQSQLIDRTNSVEISCTNPATLLFNADDDALSMGANAAMLGREAIQFARAEALGGGRYRLSGLLRGRRGSDWSMSEHAVGEPFVLLDPHSLALVAIDRAMLGATIEARAFGIADDEADPPLATVVASGESLRPLSPCHLRGAIGADGLSLSWVPRRIETLSWVSGDDPDTSAARYSVGIERGGAPVVREVTETSLHIEAAELAAMGDGTVSAAVTEIGPNGESRAARVVRI